MARTPKAPGLSDPSPKAVRKPSRPPEAAARVGAMAAPAAPPAGGGGKKSPKAPRAAASRAAAPELKTIAPSPVPSAAPAPKAVPEARASATPIRPGAAKAAAAPPPETAGHPGPTAPPKREPAEPAGPRYAGADPVDVMSLMSTEERRAVETLSLNLARAAITTQGALAEAMIASSGRGPARESDPFHVAPAMSEVMGKLALSPEKVFKAQADLFDRYLDLWISASRRAAGEETAPVATPARGDKRFNDPEWSSNPLFDILKQSYLVTSDWLNGLVDQVEDVDPLTKRRVQFFTKMLTDAFAPSNFLMSNPQALREAARSRGESLLRGAERFAADLQRGGGRLAISQTDFSKFKVGENVATAPGKVVARNELFELLQFSPTTEEAHEIPLLIFPPWINKYYIMDLRPENSMIRWLVSQGLTVFVTSWVNPDAALSDRTLEDYLYGGIYTAVEQVLEQTGVRKVNAVGYCIGGTLLSCALAHMAARGDDRIGSATFFAAQQDFAEAGDLLIFTGEEWLRDLEARIDAEGGVSPAGAMADTFNSLRANDLIWSFFVNNYLLGKEPAAFDLLFWNSDQTRMPKALHLSYLKDFYRANLLSKGELTLAGVTLDLKSVKTPVYVQSSKEDHIAPMRSVYRGAKLFGGQTTFTLAGSGHIAGVINAPAANKYQHWTNPELPETVEAWLAGASEHPGSWWPHWRAWLGERSGGLVPARDPAKGPLPPLGEAPGEYVKVRSGT